jgi:hypothetical protein
MFMLINVFNTYNELKIYSYKFISVYRVFGCSELVKQGNLMFINLHQNSAAPENNLVVIVIDFT